MKEHWILRKENVLFGIRCWQGAFHGWSPAAIGACLSVDYVARAACAIERWPVCGFCPLLHEVAAFQAWFFYFDCSSLSKSDWAASHEIAHGCSVERRCPETTRHQCACFLLPGIPSSGGEGFSIITLGFNLSWTDWAYGHPYVRCVVVSATRCLCTLNS